MITFRLTSDDLLESRFAFSPLIEAMISYYMLHRTERSLGTGFRSWIDQSQRALHGVSLPFMDDLLGACLPKPKYSYIPDFLSPTPTTTEFNMETELQRMLATPTEVIREHVQLLIDAGGETELRREFLVYPQEMLHCLAEDIRVYWQRVLAPHWAQLTNILEGDILYRARFRAVSGTQKLFPDLNPRLSLSQNSLLIEKWYDKEVDISGRGLQLVPSVFGVDHLWWQAVPEWQPMIIYTARGVGQWKQERPDLDQSLEILMGAGKASVLQALSTPSTTTELAYELHMTAGAVSQHLTRLHEAGLVEPRRSGKRVYYHLSQRGAGLLNLFDAQY